MWNEKGGCHVQRPRYAVALGVWRATVRSAGSGVAQSAAQAARSHPDRGGAVRGKGHPEGVPVDTFAFR